MIDTWVVHGDQTDGGMHRSGRTKPSVAQKNVVTIGHHIFHPHEMTKSVKVLNLPKPLRRLWVRSLELAGAGPQAKWIESQIRRYVVESQKQFGSDLFSVLSPEEAEIVRVIRDGAAEPQHIVEETLIPEERV